MKNLDRWVAAYMAMDQRRREENLDLAEADAIEHPAATLLKLRSFANGDNVVYLRRALGGPHNFGAPLVVGPIKKR